MNSYHVLPQSGLAEKDYLAWQTRRVATAAFTLPAVMAVVGLLSSSPKVPFLEACVIPIGMLGVSLYLTLVFCHFSLRARWYLIKAGDWYLNCEYHLENDNNLLPAWKDFNTSLGILYIFTAGLSCIAIGVTRDNPEPCRQGLLVALSAAIVGLAFICMALWVTFLSYRGEAKYGNAWMKAYNEFREKGIPRCC